MPCMYSTHVSAYLCTNRAPPIIEVVSPSLTTGDGSIGVLDRVVRDGEHAGRFSEVPGLLHDNISRRHKVAFLRHSQPAQHALVVAELCVEHLETLLLLTPGRVGSCTSMTMK
jgi:hypothetical protein